MRVTIAQGRLVNDIVFEGIKKFLLGTIETKGKRIKPVLTFNFIPNQEDQDEEFDVQLIDEEIPRDPQEINNDSRSSSSELGSGFHEKKDKNKKVNLGGSYRREIAKKYKKPKNRAPKRK